MLLTQRSALSPVSVTIISIRHVCSHPLPWNRFPGHYTLCFSPASLAAAFQFPLLVPLDLPNRFNRVTQSHNHSLDLIPSYVFIYLCWFALKCVTPVSTFPLNSTLMYPIAYSLFPPWLSKRCLIVASQKSNQKKPLYSAPHHPPIPLLSHQNFYSLSHLDKLQLHLSNADQNILVIFILLELLLIAP